MSVKIVTDSTADLPPGLAEKLGIVVVPLCVKFGTDVYRDGVDLQADEFYRRLVSSPSLPATSVPPPGVFVEAFTRASKGGNSVLSIHLSSKLSGTFECARLASGDLRDARVEVVDSETVSMGLGLIVIKAAEEARAGGSLDEVMLSVRNSMNRCHVIGALDTLEYLQKGGRIGRAAAFLGNVLNVKPLLSVRDGEVHPLERVRTRRRALDRICELALELQPFDEVAVLNSAAAEEADRVASCLAGVFPPVLIHRSSFGPVLGTYVGPGAVGIAVLQKRAKDDSHG